MNRLNVFIVYLIIFFGCGLVAWLIYQIASESYVEMLPGSDIVYKKPALVITSPTNQVVSQPFIQIIGYYPNEIQKVTCDITNNDDFNRSQANRIYEGYVTSRFFDKTKQQANRDRMMLAASNWVQQSRSALTNKKIGPMHSDFASGLYKSVFTTNYFQIYDVKMAKGKNCVVIHVRDEGGKQYSYRRFFILDLDSDKTSPQIKLLWPQDGASIGGDKFTLQASVDDNNARISVRVKNYLEEIQMFNPVVGRDGRIWVENIPIVTGTNKITMTATDAAGNSSTNVFSVVKGTVKVTMQPMGKDQLNKPRVNVRGTVSDISCIVKVNNIKATVHADGSWEAKDVPVSSTGTAVFDIQVFEGSKTD
jgi:hypothetical protein